MRKFSIVLVFLSVFGYGCFTDDTRTTRILQESGYTNVVTTGWAFGCSDSDTFETGFKARSPNGTPVSGVVCCGLLKSCTIRLD